jgi:hypothetical protein
LFLALAHGLPPHQPRSRRDGRQALHPRAARITVGTLVGLIASGSSREQILQAYPQLEAADIDEALAYAAWRMEEREEALVLS